MPEPNEHPILICGLGKVGYLTARLLARMGQPVAVISRDIDPFYRDKLDDYGVAFIQGDARSSRTLRDAGIHEARAVLCCTSDDLLNIEMALDALKVCPSARVIVRLFDLNLASQLERGFGITKVLAMARTSAPAFAAAALGERVRGAVTVDGEPFIVARVAEGQEPEGAHAVPGTEAEGMVDSLLPMNSLGAVEPQKARMVSAPDPLAGIRSFWAGVNPALRHVAAVLGALAVVSVAVFQFGLGISTLDAAYFVVTTLSTTGYGDITVKDADAWLKVYAILLMGLGSATMAVLYSIVTDFVVTQRFDAIRGRKRLELKGHVIVAGLGDLGLQVARELERLGKPCAVIERNLDSSYRQLLGSNAAFLAGDARSPATLERAGIHQARAVICATQDDAANLSIALAVKHLQPELRVVTRLFDEGFAAKVEELMSVDAAMSSARIAAPAFAGAALYNDALLCYEAENSFIALREANEGDIDVAKVAGYEVQVTTVPLAD